MKDTKNTRFQYNNIDIEALTYYNVPQVQSESLTYKTGVNFIIVSVTPDEIGLQERIIFLHELGHIVDRKSRPYSRPKKTLTEYKLYCEKQAWRFACKRLPKSKLIGRIIASHWLTYLVHANKLKNTKYWINRLDYYKHFAPKSTIEALDHAQEWLKVHLEST